MKNSVMDFIAKNFRQGKELKNIYLEKKIQPMICIVSF